MPSSSGQEADGPATVDGRGAERDGLTPECLGQAEVAALERHVAPRQDPAHLVLRPIGRRRQLRGIGAAADVVATGGHHQGQALVRAHVVVLVPPGVEGRLPGAEGGARRLAPEVALEGAVEALVLAQGLGMVGPAVAHGDAQATQPDGERGVGMGRVVAPGTAVIDQQTIGHPVALEGRDQLGLHRRGALIGTGPHAERVARVVVEDGEGMAAARAAGSP